MDKDTPDKSSLLFTHLVLNFHAAALQHLGKIVDRQTGKASRDLAQASLSIDMLDMLRAKCEGSLTTDEKTFLDRIISELKLNYVDETSRKDSTDDESDKAAEGLNSPSPDSKLAEG